MSWSKQIRFYYVTSFIMLTSIIGSIITSFFFHGEIKFSLFIVTLISALVSLYFYNKQWKTGTCIIVPIIPVTIYEVLTQNIFSGTFNAMFIVYVTTALIKEENEDINYDRYKRKFRIGVYGIFIAAIAYGIFELSSSNVIYRAIIIYIILVVITMREARGYCYNIKKSKSSRIFNLSLFGFAIFITQEFFYEKFVMIVKGIYLGFNYVLELILNLVILIIGPIMNWCINALKKLFNGDNSMFDNVRNSAVNQNKTGEIYVSDPISEVVSKGFEFLIKSLIILVLALIAIKLIKKIIRRSNFNRDNGYVEVVEDIDDTLKSSNKIINKLKKVFRKKGTPREEILYRYGEFVEAARARGIFKEYMTPKQLSNIVKIKVDQYEEVDVITNTYNEARFSTHCINSEKEQFVEKYVDNVNKKINNLR